jgi:hypothetical protein
MTIYHHCKYTVRIDYVENTYTIKYRGVDIAKESDIKQIMPIIQADKEARRK